MVSLFCLGSFSKRITQRFTIFRQHFSTKRLEKILFIDMGSFRKHLKLNQINITKHIMNVCKEQT